jgi:4-carboxymuconolactone decarboxylase
MARLPEIQSRDELPEAERGIYDYIEETRGGVRLPYSLFLHHPELAYRKLHVGSYVRFESSLPHDIAELAICTAAREFDCRFEWAAHAGAAPRAGVSAAALDVIA